jgi:hypothetical protein
MSKTIEQALSEMPDPEIRARALENRRKADKRHFPEKFVNDYSTAILCGFNWLKTLGGYDLWGDIYHYRITTWQQACEKYPHLRELPILSEKVADNSNEIEGPTVAQYLQLTADNENVIQQARELLEFHGYRVEEKSDNANVLLADSLPLSELKDLLCEVSQLIAGWNATEAEWSKWDEEVKQKVYELQLKIDGKQAVNFR